MHWPILFNVQNVKQVTIFKKIALNFSSDLDLALTGVEVRSALLGGFRCSGSL